MRDILRISIASAFLTVGVGAGAVTSTPEVDELPILQQESQHSVAAKRVSALFTRAHYKEISLDDALSARVYQRFIDSLDHNKQVLLLSDVVGFEKYRTLFDDALSKGNLSVAYDMYNVSAKRRIERYEFALALLEKGPFDFEKEGDKFFYDREDAEWPANKAELDEIWRQRVKYDALNLILADKTWEEAKELLTKRYTRAIKRTKQAKSEDVFQTAMNAFARTIEAHTSYLSPRNAERFQMDMNLSFEGIGAVLQSEDDYTVIKSVVPGGPADESGAIKPEDKIVGVAQDDEEFVDVIGWRLDEVVELIKGPKGSTVRLQVEKGATDAKTTSVVSLTRDKIKLEDRAAKSEVYVPETGPHAGEPLGVITIPSFYNNLSMDVAKEIESLKAQNVKGVIVDLRGNGGGSLTEATLLTGLFIEKGPVVQIRYGQSKVSVNRDTDGEVAYDGPLTVLVDRYSASASEIFAAAMQDYNRALIVGEQTFGKGTVQQHRGLGKIYDLYDNPLGSVQFTIAKFYRIDGGLDYAIERGLAYAEYADLVWCETSTPDIGEAREFAQAIHEKYPGKLLAYNCSPSFNWKMHLDDETIATFQEQLGEMGYALQFVTLSGFHSLNTAIFELAQGYRDRGMAAYSVLQEREFSLEKSVGYRAIKHQSFVGAGYFDQIQLTVTGGEASTTSLDGSTEEEQFNH